MSDLSQQENIKRSWEQPDGASFDQWMESRVARFSTRRYDWDALKFQADYDPKYRRAQMRYLGTGGTGVAADTNTVPSEHFTFSTMIIPAGHEGPSQGLPLLGPDRDVLEVRVLARDAPGRGRELVERGVDAPVRGDEGRQRLRVGAAELLDLAVAEDLLDDRVLAREALE